MHWPADYFSFKVQNLFERFHIIQDIKKEILANTDTAVVCCLGKQEIPILQNTPNFLNNPNQVLIKVLQ